MWLFSVPLLLELNDLQQTKGPKLASNNINGSVLMRSKDAKELHCRPDPRNVSRKPNILLALATIVTMCSFQEVSLAIITPDEIHLNCKCVVGLHVSLICALFFYILQVENIFLCARTNLEVRLKYRCEARARQKFMIETTSF